MNNHPSVFGLICSLHQANPRTVGKLSSSQLPEFFQDCTGRGSGGFFHVEQARTETLQYLWVSGNLHGEITWLSDICRGQGPLVTPRPRTSMLPTSPLSIALQEPCSFVAAALKWSEWNSTKDIQTTSVLLSEGDISADVRRSMLQCYYLPSHTHFNRENMGLKEHSLFPLLGTPNIQREKSVC